MKLFLKNALSFSLFVHLSVFSLLAFSFVRPPLPRALSVRFLGRILPDFELKESAGTGSYTARQGPASDFLRSISLKLMDRSVAGRKYREHTRIMAAYVLKPLYFVDTGSVKQDHAFSESLEYFVRQKARPPVFVFHPILPSSFRLYFKDRQTAHVELAFNMLTVSESMMLPVVKRKVSSGNLEADLLCKRYILNYLFAHREAFKASEWQTVKIELSEGND